MPTAKKLPSGSWRCQVYAGKDDSGKRRYESFTAPTKKEAELLASQYAVEKKVFVEKNIIFADALRIYNENRKYSLSPRTAKEYEGYRRFAFKEIENLHLDKINQKVVQTWVNNLAKKNAPKTVKNKYSYLIAFLKSNGIEVNCTLPKKRPTTYHIVLKEEVAEMLKETGSSPLGLAIRLAIFVPARRSEICALNPKTDIKGNLLTINKAKVKDSDNAWVIKDPKTYKSTRTVEMPPDLIEMLKTVPVYPNPDTLYKRFKALVKKLGYEDMRFHDLRHYGATVLHDMNVPDKEIMHRGGWSNLSTLMNIYVHYNPDTAKAAANAMNSLYDSFKE